MVWNVEFNEKSLFYLGKDNFEQNNVLSANPRIADKLEESYKKWVKDMMKPLWPPLVYFVYEDKGITYHFDN